MKYYLGRRLTVPGAHPGCTEATVLVNQDGRQRPLRFVTKFDGDPERRPTSRRPAFEWGYQGAGPADTAASILTDHLGYTPLNPLIQRFKRDVIAGLPRDGFVLPADEVAAWCALHRGELAADRAEYTELTRLDTVGRSPDDQAGGIEL